MEKDIKWEYVFEAMKSKIKELEQKVMVCNCCEQYTHELPKWQTELEIYKEEYSKILRRFLP